jgi:hypothetical protein
MRLVWAALKIQIEFDQHSRAWPDRMRSYGMLTHNDTEQLAL